MLKPSATCASGCRRPRLLTTTAAASQSATKTPDAAPAAACRLTRRALCGAAAGALLLPCTTSQALPLAPLGPVKRIGDDKLAGVSVDDAKEILARDLSEGQYFVTGNLTRELFADDCRFVDPTNDVTGLSKYVKALGLLFDPEHSQVKLLSIAATGPSTIEATWTLGGYLRFPWKPRVKEFEGRTIYTLNEQGLIQEQRQTWSISALEALVESFTPTAGPGNA